MANRLGTVRSTLSSAPWRRAPLLLRRRPGVLATVAAATAVLAASVAAVPLFRSSVGTASVGLQAAERCPSDTGATLAFEPTPAGVVDRSDSPFRLLDDRLGPSNRWGRMSGLSLSGTEPADRRRASVLVRDEAFEHVEVVEGGQGPGLWVSDRATDLLGLHAGDVARVDDVEVPVAAVYRDLSGTTVDDFWCSNADMVLLESRGGDVALPPLLLLADPTTFSRLLGSLEPAEVAAAWEAPLREGLTVTEADALVADLACAPRTGGTLPWCLGGQPPLPRPRTRSSDAPVPARDDAHFVERYLGSHLPFVTERSRAIETSVASGIWPIAGFGALAGLGLVAASASLWADRRRRAVTLLTARGVSPGLIGVKAALELALSLVVGAAAGVGLAHVGVTALGPSATIEARAMQAAAATGAMAMLGAAVTVSAVVAWRARPRLGRPRRAGALPWELLLVGATLLSYERLGEWGVPIGRGAEVSRVDLLGLLFPVLFLVTVVAVVSRVLAWCARPMRAASRSWPISLSLGIRRVTRYRAAILGLAAASALSTGVLAYATSMSRSLDATLEAKAKTFVGSDVALRLDESATLPAVLEERATGVDVYQLARIGGASAEGATVIAVDPGTFERGASWDDSFADEPLSSILERLTVAPPGGDLPAVVVGEDVEPGTTVTIRDAGVVRFTVAPIDGIRTFPGMRIASPTVFVAADALAAVDAQGSSREVWVRGDRDETLRILDDARATYVERRKAGEVVDGASFRTVTWTFGFMQSLGASAGLLALGGVVVYLDARRRDRLLGYAFMRRMGLRPSQHRRALGVELAASVVVGAWLGLGSAVAAAWLAHDRVDPVPRYQPDPLLRSATPVILGLALLAVVVAVVAAVVAQRRVDQDDPVEVLRGGT